MTSDRVLDFIERYIAYEGWAPTVREIAHGLGLRSPSTAHGHLARLERDGRIERLPGAARAIRLRDAA